MQRVTTELVECVESFIHEVSFAAPGLPVWDVGQERFGKASAGTHDARLPQFERNFGFLL
jgi:hypothetical protein